MRISKKGLWVALGVAVLIVLIIWYVYPSSKPQTTPTAPKPINVSVSPVKSLQWQKTVNVIGTIANDQASAVAAEISGRIVEIYVKPGRMVEKGQPLFRLFSKNLQAQLDTAKANLASSEPNYRRNLALYKTGNLSQQALLDARKTYQFDLAQVNQYQALLSQAIVHAPISGYAGLNYLNVGDYADTGTTLLNITPLSHLRIDFALPARYLHQLHNGEQLRFHSDAYPNKTFHASLSASNAVINQTDRNVKLRATLNDKQLQLRPGQFVQVTVPVGEKHPVLVIPETAINAALGGSFVYKITGNTVQAVPIKLVQRQDGQVAVTGKLTAQDHIVKTNNASLQSGATINIIASKP